MYIPHNSITEKKNIPNGDMKNEEIQKTIVTKGFLIYESEQRKIWYQLFPTLTR